MWCPTIETVALPDPIGTTPLDDALHGRRGQFDAVLFTSRKGIEEWLRRRPNEASRHQEGPTLYALGEPALHPLRMSELSHENILIKYYSFRAIVPVGLPPFQDFFYSFNCVLLI